MSAEVGRVESDIPVIAATDSVVDEESFVESLSHPTARAGTPVWRRAVNWFVVTSVGLVLAAGILAVAYHRIHAERVLPGVDVAGVAVGGLDRAAAAAALRDRLPDISSGAITIEIGSQTATIGFAEVGRDYDLDAMLDDAQRAGRSGGIVDELRTLIKPVSLPVRIEWNNDALVERASAVASSLSSVPSDATIAYSNGRYTVVPAVDGQSVDERAIYEAAAAIVADPARQRGEISVGPSAIPAGVATTAAQSAIDRVERVVASGLTVSAGGESLAVSRDIVRGWVRLEPAGGGSWDVEIESAPVAQLVTQLAARVERAPINATFSFDGGVAKVMPAQDGRQLDVNVGAAAAVDELMKRAEGRDAAPVNLAVVPIAADFTTSDARPLADSVGVLGTWTTKFTPSPFNGDGVNIRTPARLIDGTVLDPGETFDFVDAAGPFTRRNGYTDGAAIIHGNTKMDGVLGGGLCSASTTLFNAAARAGLQIDARHNHYYYIGRYPVGLDATIWVNGNIRKTMAFTNDSDYPILIRAHTTRRKVTFEIWGVPDGRTVSFSDPRIEDEKEAKTYIEYTDELPEGIRERVEFPADGFDSWVTRTVRDAHGQVIHEDTFFSDYGKVDGIVKQGRFPTDPPAGTRVPAHGKLGV